MYLYESHMGGLYLSEKVLSYDDLYCETCGDSDWLLGEVDTWQDVLDRITEEDGFIPYAADFLEEFKEEFDAYKSDTV